MDGRIPFAGDRLGHNACCPDHLIQPTQNRTIEPNKTRTRWRREVKLGEGRGRRRGGRRKAGSGAPGPGLSEARVSAHHLLRYACASDVMITADMFRECADP